MKIYFDTNVYNVIMRLGEGPKIRRFIKSSHHTVLASSNNIFEIYAVPDRSLCKTLLNTLITVATSFEPKPESWLQAMELRKEIARCRPQWLKRIVFKKRVRELLKGHLQNWESAKALNLPEVDAYANFRRDLDYGLIESKKSQKIFRKTQGGNWKHQVRSPQGVFMDIDLNDPEMFWRNHNLAVWYNALIVKERYCRDLDDWLSPYIKEDAFNDPSYLKFWLEDVNPEKVPRNRIIGLVDYYQLRYKISQGNSADQLHANYLFDTDVFVTADHPFHRVLTDVVNRHFDRSAKLVFLNRDTTSVIEELCTALE